MCAIRNGTRKTDVIQLVVILQLINRLKVNYTFSSKLIKYAVKYSEFYIENDVSFSGFG